MCLSPAGGGAACHHRQGQPPAAGEAVLRHEDRGTGRERKPPRAQEVPGPPHPTVSTSPGRAQSAAPGPTQRRCPGAGTFSCHPPCREPCAFSSVLPKSEGFPGLGLILCPQPNKDTDSSSQCPSVPSQACCTVLPPNPHKHPMRKGPWGNRGSRQRGTWPSQPPGGGRKQIPAPGPVLRLGSCTSMCKNGPMSVWKMHGRSCDFVSRVAW